MNTPNELDARKGEQLLHAAISSAGDAAVWAKQQAGYLRALRSDKLDVEPLAKVIDEMAENEKRELTKLVTAHMINLLKWDIEPIARTQSQADSIFAQQRRIEMELKRSPSLRECLAELNLQNSMWAAAKRAVASETGQEIDMLPDNCHWSPANLLTIGWLPPDAESAHENLRSAVASITPAISVPFVQKYKILFWSNPQAPVEVFIRRALLRPDFSILMDAAQEFGVPKLMQEWQILQDESSLEARPGRAGDRAEACSPGWKF